MENHKDEKGREYKMDTRKKKLKALILVMLPIFLYWLFVYTNEALTSTLVKIHNDTPNYDEFVLSRLFDQGRGVQVPVYGVILDVLDLLLGEWRFKAVVMLQIVVSFISVWYFYKTMLLIGLKEWLAALFVLFYGTSSVVMGWNNMVLTESLGLSGTVFMLYFILRFVRFEQLRDGICSVGITFLLIFHRPQFLLQYAVLLCYFVLKCILPNAQTKKVCRQMLLITAGGGMLILCYCAAIKHAYGIFSLSSAKTRQDFLVCLDNDFYKNCDDPAIIAEIEEQFRTAEDEEDPYMQNWAALWHCVDKYGHKWVADMAHDWITKDPGAYIRYLLETASWTVRKGEFCGYGLFDEYGRAIGVVKDLTLEQVVIVSTLEGVLMIYLWIRRKRPPWLHMALFAFTCPVIWSAFVVTNADFLRIMIYVIPPVYLSLAMFAQWYLDRLSSYTKGLT